MTKTRKFRLDEIPAHRQIHGHLIESGRGTGPMKPRQPLKCDAQTSHPGPGAKSSSAGAKALIRER
jgi:hypothetical protein